MKTFNYFKLIIRAFWAAFATLILASCGGGGGGSGGISSLGGLLPIETETCYVTTPEPNAELAALLLAPTDSGTPRSLSWNVKYLSPDGNVKTMRLGFGGALQPETVALEFAKNRPTPVLVYLAVDGYEDILPAGAIYPVNKNGSTIDASWLNGTSAQVLFDILTKADQPQKDAQHLCNYFNWQKLQEEFAKRVDEPHLVDSEDIAAKICTGKFSVTVLKEAKAYEAAFQHGSLQWVCAPYGDAKPVRAGETARFPAEPTVYLSSNGAVLIQKESAKNALVITELAR